MKKSYFLEKRIVCADASSGPLPGGNEIPVTPVSAPPPATDVPANQPPATEAQKPAKTEAAPAAPEGQKGPEAPPAVTAKQLDELATTTKENAARTIKARDNNLTTLANITLEALPPTEGLLKTKNA